jgi:hypothetical protein
LSVKPIRWACGADQARRDASTAVPQSAQIPVVGQEARCQPGRSAAGCRPAYTQGRLPAHQAGHSKGNVPPHPGTPPATPPRAANLLDRGSGAGVHSRPLGAATCLLGRVARRCCGGALHRARRRGGGVEGGSGDGQSPLTLYRITRNCLHMRRQGRPAGPSQGLLQNSDGTLRSRDPRGVRARER